MLRASLSPIARVATRCVASRTCGMTIPRAQKSIDAYFKPPNAKRSRVGENDAAATALGLTVDTSSDRRGKAASSVDAGRRESVATFPEAPTSNMPETAQTSLPEASTAGASEAAARTNPPDADEPSAAASSASLLPAPDDASLPPLASLLTCPEWRAALRSELAQPYFRELSAFLDSERAKGRRIFPPPADTFRALNECPPCRVRAVILGQDPYHGEGQAMGLSFSVRRGVPVPSSLQNIHKELLADLGCPRPAHGCLQAWARQRVLLLNAVLSVRAHEAASHAKRGWERFTDAVVRVLSRDNPGAVFLLWGRHAQEKGRAIQSRDRHLVLASAHPSGLSAHRGFFGCRHFSKTNDWLRARGEEPIDWRIPP